MSQLLRSKDRKVANAVTPNGKQASIANTFGLPAGKNYSCPGATSVCESVCYAGKLEKVFPTVKKNLLHNWELLRNADMDTMLLLLDEMINDFRKDCEKRNAPMQFRIHWDGDFFNDTYAYAWKVIINNNPDIQFWVYTRVKSAAIILKDIPNLSLYYSTDSENKTIGIDLKINHGVSLAYLAKNFLIGQTEMKELLGKPGAKCPENKKAIPLISQAGSACATCKLCIYEKSDIVFSATKKQGDNGEVYRMARNMFLNTIYHRKLVTYITAKISQNMRFLGIRFVFLRFFRYTRNITKQQKGNTMTVATATYKVGDTYTSQKSKVTGTIMEIKPQPNNTVRVKLDVNGNTRWTTWTAN